MNTPINPDQSAARSVRAPFSDDQIEAIEGWQSDDTVHPMTCGEDSSHERLFVLESGLYCPDCEYWQSWVPAVVAGWRP